MREAWASDEMPDVYERGRVTASAEMDEMNPCVDW